MESFFTFVATGLAIIIVIPFYRVIKGPTLFDRLLGTAAIGTKSLVLILLIGLFFNRLDMFIDIALAYAMLNFIGALIIAKYFSNKEQIDD